MKIPRFSGLSDNKIIEKGNTFIMREYLKDAKRVVIKVGSSTLTHSTGRMNLARADRLSMVVSDISNSGRIPTLVSSGSVALGVGRLQIQPDKGDIQKKQAAAAVGQCELMSMYDRFFSAYGKQIAQILLTKDVLDHEDRRQNAMNTFESLFSMGIIPIVNENDTVSFEGIKFADNDMLASYVSPIVSADVMIVLSDIDGLYDRSPSDEGAQLINYVAKITPEIEAMAMPGGTKRGTGGMATKLAAARFATSNGVPMIIANGKSPEILYDILEGKEVGTFFSARGVSE